MRRPCVTTTLRSITTDSLSDNHELLSALLDTLIQIDARLCAIESWVNEWEAADIMAEAAAAEHRDKSRDH